MTSQLNFKKLLLEEMDNETINSQVMADINRVTIGPTLHLHAESAICENVRKMINSQQGFGQLSFYIAKDHNEKETLLYLPHADDWEKQYKYSVSSNYASGTTSLLSLFIAANALIYNHLTWQAHEKGRIDIARRLENAFMTVKSVYIGLGLDANEEKVFPISKEDMCQIHAILD